MATDCGQWLANQVRCCRRAGRRLSAGVRSQRWNDAVPARVSLISARQKLAAEHACLAFDVSYHAQACPVAYDRFLLGRIMLLRLVAESGIHPAEADDLETCMLQSLHACCCGLSADTGLPAFNIRSRGQAEVPVQNPAFHRVLIQRAHFMTAAAMSNPHASALW